MLAGLFVSVDISDFGIDEILSLTVGLFAIVLLIISFLSYRKTGLLRMLLISAAFGLFAAKTLLHHLGIFVLNWTAQTEDLVFTALDLVILVLFFLALTAGK